MIINVNPEAISFPPELSTERLILKPVVEELRDFVFKTLCDPEVRHTMKMPVLNEPDIQNRWWLKFEEWRSKGEAVQWCAFSKVDGRYVGLFTIKEIDQKNSRGELGYSIMKDLWGMGYGTEGSREVLKFGFQHVDFHSIFAMILPYNTPSQRIVKRLGFEQEAHFKQIHFYQNVFYDVLQFSIINPSHNS